MVESHRPEQADHHPELQQTRRPGHPAQTCRTGRRGDRELPTRGDGEMEPRARRITDDQPGIGGLAGHRVRPDRAVRHPPRVRHPRRGHVRAGPPDRATGRTADAAAVRAGRRGRRPDRRLRGHARPLPPGRPPRPRPGHRPVPARTAGRHPRTRAQRLRPARAHRRAAREPVQQQRPPQYLPHHRRPLGGHLGQHHVRRAACHAPRRKTGHRRTTLVPAGRGTGHTLRHHRRPGRPMDR